LATISGGALLGCGLGVEVDGIRISWSGLEKRAVRVAAWAEVGVRARFLVGRLERGSWEVGIDSGIGSDIVAADGRRYAVLQWRTLESRNVAYDYVVRRLLDNHFQIL
jgi:hypothetical protein